MALPRSIVVWLWSLFSYIPGLNLLGVSIYSTLGSAVLALRTPASFLRRQKFPAILLAALVAAGIATMSTLWSPTPLDAWIAAFGWLGLAAGVFAVSHLLWTQGAGAVGKVLFLSAPIVAAQAFSTILFRFQPQTELAYYGGSLARIILGASANELASGQTTNNVLEADRAGGFLFTSVNRAALVMGVMMLTYIAYALLYRRRWPWLLVVTLAAAVILGGSKTGLALTFLLPAFAIVTAAVARSSNASGKLAIVFAALIIGASAIQIFLSTADDYITASEQTLLPRLTLWSESARAISENPLLGLGFGGWYERWAAGNVEADFSMRPAHNWVLQAWMDGGALYVIACAAFVATAVSLLLRAVTVDGTFREKAARTFAGAAFLWCFIHGMGDNTPLTADPPAVLYLSICAAIMITATLRPDSEVQRQMPSEKAAVSERGNQAGRT